MTGQWSQEQQNRLSALLANKVKFCGCGSNRKWHTMLMLLDEAEDHKRKCGFYDEDESEQPWFWEFSANCLDGMGLIEHGTGIGFSWLTEEGALLLEFLRESLIDGEFKWPEWAEGDI